MSALVIEAAPRVRRGHVVAAVGAVLASLAGAAAIYASLDSAPAPDPAPRQPVAPVAPAPEPEPPAADELVAEFTSRYEAGQPRVTNIRRAVAALDGTVLRPGETFSMNDALGERTTAKGYVPAPMIAGGRLVDSVGGGISQVATVLYNAAFFAGLELVEHTPHSFFIDRYPVGREATISWGGPELVVRNDWAAPLRMELVATDTAVTARFYSARLGRRVVSTTGEPYAYLDPTTIELSTRALPPGARSPVQSAGAAGFTVEYTRRVYARATLRRDERFRTRYEPQNAIVAVGVGAGNGR